MQKLFVLLILVLLSSCNRETWNPSPELIGTWKFPGTMVWVQISKDGTAFQCRISKGQDILKSPGKVDNYTIYWEEKWFTDIAEVTGDVLSLDGEYGKFNYHKTSEEMSPKCENPLLERST